MKVIVVGSTMRGASGSETKGESREARYDMARLLRDRRVGLAFSSDSEEDIAAANLLMRRRKDIFDNSSAYISQALRRTSSGELGQPVEALNFVSRLYDYWKDLESIGATKDIDGSYSLLIFVNRYAIPLMRGFFNGKKLDSVTIETSHGMLILEADDYEDRYGG